MGEPGKFSDPRISYHRRSHAETSCNHDDMVSDAVRRGCIWLERSSVAFPSYRDTRIGDLFHLFTSETTE